MATKRTFEENLALTKARAICCRQKSQSQTGAAPALARGCASCA
jgi:hypothetical protein